MPPETSLTKRIRRHVIGRRRTYFAAAAPGFEALCRDELAEPGLAVEMASIVDGGVEFEGRLEDCYLANLHLRTAGRILMRIDGFRATGFGQLEKKLAGIPWELYLPLAGLPQVHVTVRHCRLYHSAAIGQRVADCISSRLFNGGINGRGKKEIRSDLSVFVRGADDRFTVSIDSSGKHLHKRGLKRHPGRAPIRETMAAAALRMIGYDGTQPLLDPMCGTGTFSLEAALIAANIPPGWFREFAFMSWPSFSPKRWEYLKGRCEAEFTDRPKPLIFASDRDSSACRRLETCVRQNRLANSITVSRKDFFDLLPAKITRGKGVVAINPPYGKRLGRFEESQALFSAIGEKLDREYRGWKVILVAPHRTFVQKIPFKLHTQHFFHGGLKPVLMTGKIP